MLQDTNKKLNEVRQEQLNKLYAGLSHPVHIFISYISLFYIGLRPVFAVYRALLPIQILINFLTPLRIYYLTVQGLGGGITSIIEFSASIQLQSKYTAHNTHHTHISHMCIFYEFTQTKAHRHRKLAHRSPIQVILQQAIDRTYTDQHRHKTTQELNISIVSHLTDM